MLNFIRFTSIAVTINNQIKSPFSRSALKTLYKNFYITQNFGRNRYQAALCSSDLFYLC